MPRVRSPERDKAKELYIQHNIKLIDIAQQLGVLDTQIRKWKSQDKWDNELEGKGTLPNTKRNVTNKKVQKDKEEKETISQVVKEVMENVELTDKQKDFCLYYVKYRNQVKAYMKAYNSSYLNACSHAWEVWNRVEIQREIDNQLELIREGIKLDIMDLVKLNMDIAFADMKDYTEWGKKEIEVDKDEEGEPIKVEVNYVDFKESEEVDGTLVSEVKKGKDGVSIKLQDKGKAIDFLYKHLVYVSEEDKRKLEIANKDYQNEKLKAEINKLTGNNQEIEDTSDIDALLE